MYWVIDKFLSGCLKVYIALERFISLLEVGMMPVMQLSSPVVLVLVTNYRYRKDKVIYLTLTIQVGNTANISQIMKWEKILLNENYQVKQN